MSKKRAIIIGAGPAGLTAAHELLERTDVEPVVLEQDDIVGGISRTVHHNGNRIDIGGHRFFSKSRRVMDWWLRMLPLQKTGGGQSSFTIQYQNKSREVAAADDGPDPEIEDSVMLVRSRKSRIYFNRRFFDYPLSLNAQTLTNLGAVRTTKIGLSYVKSSLMQIRPETNLEEFLINRFGRELYLTFFKSYTEKVWGTPCDKISAEWGAQRIKGLSVAKALTNALAKPFRKNRGVDQKGVETSLIEQFLYPKFGPGQMWETCAARIEERGGSIRFGRKVEHVRTEGERIVELTTVDRRTGARETFAGDYFFSTMPVQKLVRSFDAEVPATVRNVNDGLIYRDFITVGLLVPELKIRDADRPDLNHPTDNWIYIQEPDVHVGRLQIFNNWSPYMVADPRTVWLGLEYFCNKGDALWNRSDAEMTKLGVEELTKIGIIDGKRVLDSTVIRVPKTYPAYFGTYDRFPELRSWVDRYKNLFLLGRNGMHRYNNQDHSMLTAMTAIDNIAAGRENKDNIWDVNVEKEYHEEKGDQRTREFSAASGS
jgi:protoporphyrinogen oxidase